MKLHKTFILRNDTNAQALWAFLKANWRSMADCGKFLAVTVTEYWSKRSIEQNARYWKILSVIAENAWLDGKQFDSELWHEFFKRKFLGIRDLPDGSVIGNSTVGLNVENFAEFMQNVEQFATFELGVIFDE